MKKLQLALSKHRLAILQLFSLSVLILSFASLTIALDYDIDTREKEDGNTHPERELKNASNFRDVGSKNSYFDVEDCCPENLLSNGSFENDSPLLNEAFPNSTLSIANNAITTTLIDQWVYEDGNNNGDPMPLIFDPSRASEGDYLLYMPIFPLSPGNTFNRCIGDNLENGGQPGECAVSGQINPGLRYLFSFDFVIFNRNVPEGGSGAGGGLPAVEYFDGPSFIEIPVYDEDGTEYELSNGLIPAVAWDDVATSWETAYALTSNLNGGNGGGGDAKFYFSTANTATAGMLFDNLKIEPLQISAGVADNFQCSDSDNEIEFTLNPESNLEGSFPANYTVSAPAGYSVSPTIAPYGEETSFVLTLLSGDFSTGLPVSVDVQLEDEVNNNCFVVATIDNPYPSCGSPSVSIDQVDITCDLIDDLGSMTVIPTGFSGQSLMYDWSEDSYDGLPMITNVPAGNYIVTVSDLSGNTASATALITQEDCPLDPCEDGDLGGIVFNDYDFDGIIDVDEDSIQGIKVYIYECDNPSPVDSTVTNFQGEWLVTDLVDFPYRVEYDFSALPNLIPSNSGANNATSVQFIDAPSCDIDLALIDRDAYCDDLLLITPCFVNGDNTGTQDILLKWSYENEGVATLDKVKISNANQAGSLWGVAYDSGNELLYTSAVLKRHVGLGPAGLDGIYLVDPFSGAANATIWLELEDDLSIDVGQSLVASNSDRGLGAIGDPNNDTDAFSVVGTVGLGDIELSEDDSTLYVMNLFDKKLYVIDVATKTIDTSYLVPDPQCGAEGTYRPWGIAVHEGQVYVSSVCDGSNAGANPQDLSDISARQYLSAQVYRLENESFVEVLSFPLDYTREPTDAYNGTCNPNITGWYGWVNTLQAACNGNVISYPQPILTDIEFDDKGGMILGFTDRTGYQIGNNNYGPIAVTEPQPLFNNTAGGDILYACKSGNVWTIEGSGCTNSNGEGMGTTNMTYNFGEWPSLGEYFVGDFFQNNGDIVVPGFWPGHPEIVVGGLAVAPGTKEVIATAFDPVTGGNNFATGGTIRLSTESGRRTTNGFQIYSNSSVTAGKGVGLGDVELICTPGPMQIGNYVWIDADEDGVQDACEASFSNLTVKLYIKPDTEDPELVATTVTDNDGNYYFTNSASLTETWEEGFTEILQDTSYIVAFCGDTPNSTGSIESNGVFYTLTSMDTGEGLTPDNNDSDASLQLLDGNLVPAYCINTENFVNNYTIDAGLFLGSSGIGDTVFVDVNANGMQDSEPGIEGVTVSLFDAITGSEVTSDIDGTTISPTFTNNEGYYKFENLASGSYYVEFDVTTNVDGIVYAPTIQNVNGINLDPNDSDIDEFGRSDTTTIVAGQMDCTLDAGFIIPSKVAVEVFLDVNKDGINMGSDAPVEGLMVSLLDESGMPVTQGATGPISSTSMSDPMGMTEFDDLQPGMYQVSFDLNSVLGQSAFTLEGQGAENIDSDVPAGMSLAGIASTPIFAVLSGDTIDNFAAGIVACEVQVLLSPEQDFCIDLAGNQVINAIPSNGVGIYTYLWSTGATGPSITVSPASTTEYTVTVTDELGCREEASVRIVECSNIGDAVWFDIDQDGIQDANEPGVPGVTVFLLDENMMNIDDPDMPGTPWSIVTDEDGQYNFDNIFIDPDNDTFFVEFTIDPTVGTLPSPVQDPDVNSMGAMDTETDSDIDVMNPTPNGFTSGEIILFQDTVFTNIDAGIMGNDTIGDFVFLDENGNGVQDMGEEGIEDDTVFLKINGVIVDTTVTDATGFYQFADLIPSASFEYSAQFETPEGFYPTIANAGIDEELDSDLDPSMMNMTEGVTFLMPDSNNMSLDAGFFEPISIGDTVWVDENGNGLQDVGEAPIENVTVSLFLLDDLGMAVQVTSDLDGLPLPTVTDSDGRYKFENLAPGEYYVNFDVTTATQGSDLIATIENVNGSTGDLQDSDVDELGNSDTVLVTSGNMDCTLDAGYFLPVSVGDTAFVDTNFNGIQDIGEPGLPGVTVTLFDTSGTQITMDLDGNLLPTMTDPNGYYKFENLAPNEYYVVFDVTSSSDPMAAIFVPTIQNVNGVTGDPSDSDIDASGSSDTVSVASGGMDCTLDAGYFAPTSIGDTVFVDLNGNGLQDPLDPGIDSVMVTVFDAITGTEVTTDFEGNPLNPTYSNSDGYYKIDSLSPGTYYVVFDVSTSNDPSAADFLPTLQNANGGSLDPDDSDIDASGVSDTTAMIGSGEMDCTLDAGYFVPISVGDTVFVDVNGNGLQDPLEPGIPGVEVDLYKLEMGVGILQTEDYSGNDITSVATNGDGYYKFEGLAPGEYYVEFDVSTATYGNAGSYVATTENVSGTLASDDSDITQAGISDTTAFINSGEMDCTLDAGYFVPVSVGDTVFVDVNGNGIQDPTDDPIEDVVVTLYELDDMGNGVQVTEDAEGDPVTPANTNPDGSYLFDNLPPGEYYVEFDLVTNVPDGSDYVPTFQNTGTDDNIDSDVNQMFVSDTTDFLVSDEEDLSLDAGFFIPVSIGDTVFVDTNFNGLQDPMEPGIPGVSVSLFDTSGTQITMDFNGVALPTMTDPNGYYKFENLPLNEYYVVFDASTASDPDALNFVATLENIGGTLSANDSDINTAGISDTTNVESGEMDCTLDAGYFVPVAVGDTVFVDVNGNGLQDTNEPGIDSVLVRVFDGLTGMEITTDFAGDSLDPTYTNADGFYKIDSLLPGTYFVIFDVSVSLSDPNASEYVPTVQNVNGMILSVNDSDIDFAETSDTTAMLNSGEMDCTLDAGYFVPVSIGDTAWVDANGNGLQDPLEEGLEGVSVSLYKVVGTDSILQTEDYLGNDITGLTTDMDGYYLFDSLMPGIYYVEFNEPAASDFTLTTPDQGMDETIDSDPDVITMTSELTAFLESGDSDPNIDAGFFIPVSVGDTVFVDVNGDGLQDDMDLPLEGVIVTLFELDEMGIGILVTEDADLNPILPITTGQDGRYKFENLPPGEYYVEFDLITNVTDGADYVATLYQEGTDASIDSDVDMLFRSDTTLFLLSDSMDCSLDAGFFIPVSVGDTVFVDNNGNGLQDDDPLESGIPDVGVTLYKVNEMGIGVIQTTDFLGNDISDVVTGSDGSYKFENLQPGIYYVEFDVNNDLNGTNYYPTYDNITGAELVANDSDISEDGGLTSDTTDFLTTGMMDCTQDAGFFEPISIGDTTFVDANLDGIQDPGEPGLSGIEVTLFYFNPDSMTFVEVTEDVNGDPVVPVFTDEMGSYLFDDLPPGEYFVEFDADGIPITLEDQGNDDNIDSDVNETGQSDTLLVLSTDVINTSFDAGYQGLDYGDLPDTYVTSDSINMGNAPKHVIRDYKYLGVKVDQDVDGAPTQDGLGDDNTGSPYTLPDGQEGGDDEDGIEFLSPMIPGNVAYLKMTYTAPDSPSINDAFINAWIDFDGNGSFEMTDALIFSEVDGATITPTSNLGLPAATEQMVILTFTVPEDAIFFDGNAMSRFRYSCEGNLEPDSGLVLDGEIEDYVVPLGKLGNLVWLDENFDGLQDVSDPEQVLPGVQVVLSYDTIANGQTISIIDTIVTDSEGKYSFCGLIESPGAKYQLTLITPDGLASTMMNIGSDENVDSDADIIVGEEGRDSIQTDPFMIMDVTNLPTGENGQADEPNIVNDFPDNQVDQTYDFGLVAIDFGDLPELDFGDLPISYATSEDGSIDPPRHIVTINKRLGSCVDSEPDGQPDEMGMGDDDNMDDTDEEFSFGDCSAGSDEDGIEYLTPLIPGDTAFIKVTYTLPAPIGNGSAGFLNGWIDFNGDGMLTNAEDQIAFFKTSGPDIGISNANLELESGADEMLILGFEVPASATYNGGTVFSRFRLSCEGDLLPVGILANGEIPEGEVEDYVVPLTKIGNLVWLDQNYDGIQDTTISTAELGIPDVAVNLTYTYVDPENNIDLSIEVDTLTNADGKYSFCGLLADDLGEYKITVVSPEFMTPTVVDNPTGSDSLDSDHAMNMGDSIVMTEVFQIPSIDDIPLMEDGIEDDPNFLGTFPDSLFDQTFDFGFVPLDYGDLDSTYVTASEDGGPVHVVSENKFLGQGSDAERTAAVDSIGGAIADGDDNAPGLIVPDGITLDDDEDGIKFITPLIPGFKATISVDYTLVEEDGFLNGWIDFNGNGMLDTAEALEFYSDGVAPSTDGTLAMAIDTTVELCFDVPADAVYNEGNVHARFRLSCEGGLTPEGGFAAPIIDGPQAPQGEVEDYFIPLAKIGNLAFFDNNLDGIQDGNVGVNPEIGVPMVNQILTFAGFESSTFGDDDDILYPVQTDANGNYFVCGLIEGTYDILPTKYVTGAETPEDTIPVRYILTIPDNTSDDNLDSDFAPNIEIIVPNLLFEDLLSDENGYLDDPGNLGFPDDQDALHYDQGWIPEPNIEAVTNIAGFDYPESGYCRHFNIIADVCIKNTGFVEMNGELIGANLTDLVADIDLGAQFNAALVGVVGDPVILTDLGYDGSPVTNPVDLSGFPASNDEFDGAVDINAFNDGGFLAPDEEVCLRVTFEINPTVLPLDEALMLTFNAVVSAAAVNDADQAIPDFFNEGAQFIAVDSSDMNFDAFDGTYDDPNVPSPIGDCWHETKDINQFAFLNISYDENCEALVTPEMLLSTYIDGCDKADYPLGGFYRMRLEDLNGEIIIDYQECLLLDDPAFVGNMYNISTQTISEACNSNWGKVTIENKFPPVLECVSDTITCGDLISLAPPTVVNNCGNITVTMIDESFLDVSCVDDELQTVITQVWMASDETGTRTDTCTQNLSIRKFDVNTIEAPFNLDTILSCSGDYPLDENGNPHPVVLGVPTLNGVNLWPDQFIECNVYIDYEDEVFNFGNDCTSGIQRTWTISNWVCGSDNSITFGQLITFIDTTGPVISDVPSDVTLSTGGTSCEALVVIPAVTVEDACNNNNLSVDLNYDGGFIEDQNGAMITLTAGVNTVNYIAYDECGNSSTASYTVTVQDLADPVTICDAFTTVSLNTEGIASLTADKLDDGSFDECGSVNLEIRRMEVEAGQEDDLVFGEEVDFSCTDVGNDVMVALQVTDESGNSNICMASVEVQDKIPVTMVVGLPDITVSCTFPYDEDNLDVFGKVVNDPDDRETIVITSDTLNFSGPALDAVVIDNCSTATTSEIVDSELNNCGIGFIDRLITATSPAGETTTITQRITFVNPSPFVLGDITWPEDYTLTNSCNGDDLLPGNLPALNGFPVLEEDICDMVSSTFEDRVVENTPDGGGCVLIERKWYVSDWCQKVDDQFIVFEHLQFITISNTIAPVIDLESCRDTLIESTAADCGDTFLTLTASASDDCVAEEDLIWSYEIDLDTDGTVDMSGTSSEVSGDYSVGRHSITWVVSDGCGNSDFCVEVFEIVNEKNPSAKCISGLSAALTPMDTTGDGTIDAEMFILTPDFLDAGSDHVCGYDITLSFSSDENDTLIEYNCEDRGQQAVQLWATDINGNQGFCSTFIIVEDNNEVDFCEGLDGLLTVSGTLSTEDEVKIEEAVVQLEGAEATEYTDESGTYEFSEMPSGGSYEIEPSLNKEPMNGVTTLDLVLIQNHILGKSTLSSPYKLLAADINNNGKITGADLIELRKMILGLYDEFPENKSWRFVDATHTFLDETNPWGQIIPETYPIYDLSTNMVVDFIGLKVGDVNSTVMMNGHTNSVPRSIEEAFELSYEDQLLKSGEIVSVAFYGEGLEALLGYQYTMRVDPKKAEIIGVESVSDVMTSEHFGERFLGKGIITSSWHRMDNMVHDETSPIFEVQLRMKKDGQLSELLSLTDDIAKSEAYDGLGMIKEVVLGQRNGEDIEQASLLQNRPNPWTKTTVITFNLPKATKAQLLIYDINGKLVQEYESEYTAGQHEIELDEKMFSAHGVYYYELITDDYRLSKKMVLLR